MGAQVTLKTITAGQFISLLKDTRVSGFTRGMGVLVLDKKTKKIEVVYEKDKDFETNMLGKKRSLSLKEINALGRKFLKAVETQPNDAKAIGEELRIMAVKRKVAEQEMGGMARLFAKVCDAVSNLFRGFGLKTTATLTWGISEKYAAIGKKAKPEDARAAGRATGATTTATTATTATSAPEKKWKSRPAPAFVSPSPAAAAAAAAAPESPLTIMRPYLDDVASYLAEKKYASRDNATTVGIFGDDEAKGNFFAMLYKAGELNRENMKDFVAFLVHGPGSENMLLWLDLLCEDEALMKNFVAVMDGLDDIHFEKYWEIEYHNVLSATPKVQRGKRLKVALQTLSEESILKLLTSNSFLTKILANKRDGYTEAAAVALKSANRFKLIEGLLEEKMQELEQDQEHFSQNSLSSYKLSKLPELRSLIQELKDALTALYSISVGDDESSQDSRERVKRALNQQLAPRKP